MPRRSARARWPLDHRRGGPTAHRGPDRGPRRRHPAARPEPAHLSEQAGAGRIRLLAHDVESAEEIARVWEAGAAVAEFPTTRRAAEAAKAVGMPVVAGAPNVLRGGSHSGNVSAAELTGAALSMLRPHTANPPAAAAWWAAASRAARVRILSTTRLEAALVAEGATDASADACSDTHRLVDLAPPPGRPGRGRGDGHAGGRRGPRRARTPRRLRHRPHPPLVGRDRRHPEPGRELAEVLARAAAEGHGVPT
ncbi:hypothetical protein NKH77_22985 [Streptomyces sp. M19]